MGAHGMGVKMRGPAAGAALALVCSLGGAAPAPAADAPAPPGQGRALADVAGRTISVADLEGYVRMRPQKRDVEPGEEAVRRRLEELVQTEALYAEALRRGIDREPDVRQTIRQVVVQRLLEREVDRPAFERKIAEDELKRYYDEHLTDFVRTERARASDIFFAAPESGDPAVRAEKRKKAEAVLAEALALQDTRFGFGELVLKHSDEPAGRPKGDTGFFDREGKPGGIPRQLAEALFAVERPGAMTGSVVAAPDGFYIAMLTGRQSAVSRPFEDEGVRREIDDRIRTAERRRRQDEFVAAIRSAAGVKVDEAALGELLAALRAEGAASQIGLPVLPGASSQQAPPSVPGIGR
ncbi:MAG TPA: peptidylprolyl isomerase [bacterium]